MQPRLPSLVDLWGSPRGNGVASSLLLGPDTRKPSESFSRIIFDCQVYRNAVYLVGGVGSINYAAGTACLRRFLPAPPRSHSRGDAGAQALVPPPCPALHRPARVRSDGRTAEEAEAEPALGRALHRQRHHRTTAVHALPAHLGGRSLRGRRAGPGPGPGRGGGCPDARASTHPDLEFLPSLAVLEAQPCLCAGQ